MLQLLFSSSLIDQQDFLMCSQIKEKHFFECSHLILNIVHLYSDILSIICLDLFLGVIKNTFQFVHLVNYLGMFIGIWILKNLKIVFCKVQFLPHLYHDPPELKKRTSRWVGGYHENVPQVGSTQLWKLTWTYLVHSKVKFVSFTNFYVKGNNLFTTVGSEQSV